MPGEAVLERSKCIVCKELPKDKVLQCTNGHNHCEQCFSTTRPCQRCGITTPCEIRNTFVEHELGSLELDCDHKVSGCELKVNWKELRAHAETCIFRQFVPLCSQMGLDCPFQLPRNNNVQAVIDHFKENHLFHGCLIGNPFSLILADFHGASQDSMKSYWPPLLVRSVMGGNLAPLFTVLFASTVPVGEGVNRLSVAAISLSDLYPVGGPTEIQPRAEFSIMAVRGEMNMGWSFVPSPSMNCKEHLSNPPSRFLFHLPHYLDHDGSLKIRCNIRLPTSSSAQNEVVVPVVNVTCIPFERVAAWDSLVPRLEEPQRQHEGEPSGSPAGNGGANDRA